MDVLWRTIRNNVGILLLLVLWGCHSGGEQASSLSHPVVNPLEVSLDAPDSLTLLGVSSEGFNPAAVELRYVLNGATFDAARDETSVTINGEAVAADKISVTGQEVLMAAVLTDGKNEILFKSYDKSGRPLYLAKTIWSGENTLQVKIVDAAGAAFLDPVAIRLAPSDDPAIEARSTTTSGIAEFQSIPSRTVVIEARSGSNFLGTSAGIGWDGTITVRMAGLNPPSTVANNDFSARLEGWTHEGNEVTIVPHVEQVGPSGALGLSGQMAARSDIVHRLHEHSAAELRGQATAFAQNNQEDNDLQITTQDQGPKSVSRTFETKPGTTSVVVRYHFVTREVPGGYFGSGYNDYFSVNLRSKQAGGTAFESNTMNGLGLRAFDGRGATTWRTVTLKTAAAGDEVQLDAVVANVADGLLDSWLIIDGIVENGAKVVPALTWDPVAGGIKLAYTVTGEKALENDVKINVYWANGTGYTAKLGDALFTHVVRAGTAPGTGSPVALSGAKLVEDPAGTTHLLAAASETAVTALADVRIEYGANANASVVSAAMIDVVKDGLRAAGTSRARITSTARTPFDQARAMFNNLVNPSHSVATNTTNQLLLYGPGGDAVINVFSNATAGRTLAQIHATAAEVRSLMQAKIVERGPATVSSHCADPATVSVVDIGATAFSASNSQLFREAVRPRLRPATTGFIDERVTNNAYHLEL